MSPYEHRGSFPSSKENKGYQFDRFGVTLVFKDMYKLGQLIKLSGSLTIGWGKIKIGGL
jgi:hypothetical protein